LSGFIRGEIIRFIKRCSSAADAARMQCLFWERLRARGYSVSFLRSVFAAAPTYAERSALLMRNALRSAATPRAHVLILAYNASLARANLAAALHEHRVLLPAHLRTAFIVAWRVPQKLSALLVPFRFKPLT
jgi:hypothetical protein